MMSCFYPPNLFLSLITPESLLFINPELIDRKLFRFSFKNSSFNRIPSSYFLLRNFRYLFVGYSSRDHSCSDWLFEKTNNLLLLFLFLFLLAFTFFLFFGGSFPIMTVLPFDFIKGVPGFSDTFLLFCLYLSSDLLVLFSLFGYFFVGFCLLIFLLDLFVNFLFIFLSLLLECPS